MNRIRQLIWNMGMVPNRTTIIFVGISLASCLAIIVFGILLAITGNSIFKLLIVLAAAPATILALGGSRFGLSWLAASREERAHLERERMLDLLRSWLRSNSSEKKDTRQP